MQILDQRARARERLDLVDQLHVEHLLRRAHVVAVLAVEALTGEGGDQLIAAHPDVPVDAPQRQDEPVRAERAVPGERVVVVGVHQRAVDVQDRRGHGVYATERACSACLPSANSSTILAQNAGRSSGLRELVSPASTWTSSSTQLPPAFSMSVFSDGHDVIVRPLSTSASTSVHGPWQITPTGFCLLEERLDKPDRVLVRAQEVRVRHAAREHEPVVVGRVGVGDRLVDGERVGLVEMVERLDLTVLDRDQLGLAARLLDGLPRLGQLHLLDAFGGEERDRLALQFIGHGPGATHRPRRFTGARAG